MNKPQNIYDNEEFFSGYQALRDNAFNYNDLLEQPAMEELLPEINGKRVLDLGCGYGRCCRKFIQKGADYVLGIDLSEKMLTKARMENADSKIEYRQMDMSDLSTVKQRFDVVYSSLAFHYIEDFNKLINGIYNHLTPGGTLLFSQEHPIMTATLDGNSYWVKNEDGVKSAYTFSNYNQSGERKIHWYVDGVIKYHRPMGEIVSVIAKNGFIIQELVEPTPKEWAIQKLPSIVKEFLKPNFLLIKARK